MEPYDTEEKDIRGEYGGSFVFSMVFVDKKRNIE